MVDWNEVIALSVLILALTSVLTLAITVIQHSDPDFDEVDELPRYFIDRDGHRVHDRFDDANWCTFYGPSRETNAERYCAELNCAELNGAE